MKKLQIVFISFLLVIVVILVAFFITRESIDEQGQESIDKSYDVSIVLPEETTETPVEPLYTIVGNDLYIDNVVFTDCIDKLSVADSPYTLEEFCNYIAQNVPEDFGGECYLSVHSYSDDPYYTNVYADYTSYEDPNLAELIRTYNEYPTCEIILVSSDLTESVQIESCSKYVFKKEVNYGED